MAPAGTAASIEASLSPPGSNLADYAGETPPLVDDIEVPAADPGEASITKRKGGRKPIYSTTEERKQRNRQAQAAFRTRRSDYIKNLEHKINATTKQAQDSEANVARLHNECMMLRYKNALLERVLVEKGIDIHAELKNYDVRPNSVGSSANATVPAGQRQPRLLKPGPPRVAHETYSPSKAARHDGFTGQSMPPAHDNPFANMTPSTHPPSEVTLAHTDLRALARHRQARARDVQAAQGYALARGQNWAGTTSSHINEAVHEIPAADNVELSHGNFDMEHADIDPHFQSQHSALMSSPAESYHNQVSFKMGPGVPYISSGKLSLSHSLPPFNWNFVRPRLISLVHIGANSVAQQSNADDQLQQNSHPRPSASPQTSHPVTNSQPYPMNFSSTHDYTHDSRHMQYNMNDQHSLAMDFSGLDNSLQMFPTSYDAQFHNVHEMTS